MEMLNSPSKDLERLETELAIALANQSMPPDWCCDLQERIAAIRARGEVPVEN